MDPGKGISEEARKKMESGIFYVAGIDSGSTSTDGSYWIRMEKLNRR